MSANICIACLALFYAARSTFFGMYQGARYIELDKETMLKSMMVFSVIVVPVVSRFQVKYVFSVDQIMSPALFAPVIGLVIVVWLVIALRSSK